MEAISYGNGHGSSDGYGDGYGYGSSSSYGYGNGYGYGHGHGDGYGDGDGYGYGYNYGNGDGHGHGDGVWSWKLVASQLDAHWVMAEENQEHKRLMIEAMGADRFFGQLHGKVIHQDIDGAGNQRQLLRFPCPDAEAGYLQCVRVVCPTTDRVYYLGVLPDVQTCQEAVASTFGLTAEEYRPERES